MHDDLEPVSRSTEAATVLNALSSVHSPDTVTLPEISQRAASKHFVVVVQRLDGDVVIENNAPEQHKRRHFNRNTTLDQAMKQSKNKNNAPLQREQ